MTLVQFLTMFEITLFYNLILNKKQRVCFSDRGPQKHPERALKDLRNQVGGLLLRLPRVGRC